MATIYTYAQLIAPTDQAAHKTVILQALQDAGFTGAFTWQSGTSPLAFVETQADAVTRFDANAAILAKGALSDEAEDDTLTVLSDQVYDNQRMAGRSTRGRLLLVDAASVGPFTFQAESVSFSIGRGGRLYNGYGGTVTLPRAGQLLLNVESDETGAIYALAPAGTITYFARGVLPGVTVTNQTDWLSGADAQVGTDDESDPRLRTRNRSKWGSLGAGSPESAYRSWALAADPQVQRVAVLANVNMLDPGVATVLIAGTSGALGGSVVAAVQNAIAPAQIGGELIPETARAVVASAVNRTITISGVIYVQREYNTTAFQAGVAADVATFFADMDIGQLVSWERCLEVITQRAGLSARVIYNVENFAPSADVPLLYNEVAVPFLSLTYVSV